MRKQTVLIDRDEFADLLAMARGYSEHLWEWYWDDGSDLDEEGQKEFDDNWKFMDNLEKKYLR